MSSELQNFTFHGKTLKLSEQPNNIRQKLLQLHSLEAVLRDKQSLVAILNKAKNAYVYDLKRELLTEKSGFNFLDN